jgi:AbrB family looped-hinge helix DNA binding protein
MTETTMSVKGQIVIPHEIRERLGLKAGQKFEVDTLSDGTILIIPIPREVVEGLKLPGAERLEKALTEERRREGGRNRGLAEEIKNR